LPAKDSDSQTIYDIADTVMWNKMVLDLDGSPYLTHIGEVITFQFTCWDDKKKHGVQVPALWYPDRYLESGRQAALDMRLQKQSLENELYRMNQLERGLTHKALPSGKVVSIKDLFKAALQHDVDELEGDASTTNHDSEEYDMPIRSDRSRNLSRELMKLSERIDRKLLGNNGISKSGFHWHFPALAEENEKTKEALRELSKLYTQQSDDPNEPKLHKYTLRGVSTSKNTMYVCRQAELDLIDMSLGSEDSEVGQDEQWWKISYAPSESKPVQVEVCLSLFVC